MKKIMFNDRYGLTEAVLKGQKMQLRRIIKCPKTFKGEYKGKPYVIKVMKCTECGKIKKIKLV